MNTKVLRAGTETVARHPGKAMRLSLFAMKRRRAILLLIESTRRVGQVGSEVKHAASDPKVQKETSSAVSSLVLAGRRARRVGVAKAPNDKQVAAQLRRAGRHASKAIIAARQPRRRHPLLRTTTIVTGAGALGGAAYAGWKAYDRSSPSTLAIKPVSPSEPSPKDDKTQD